MFLKAILLGVPLGVTFVDCVGYIAKVDGVSMQPSLNPDPYASSDFVFLSRWSWRKFNYSRGDVVSLTSPKNPNQAIIKRVIGLEGDRVNTIGYKERFLQVPQGHCWVEGDHTGHSLDSNHFGPVALGLITARATRIVWPPHRWGVIESQVPKGRHTLKNSVTYKSNIYHSDRSEVVDS